MDLQGKVVLVTGGGVRIGRAICEAFAAQGACVVIQYRSSRKEAVALAKDLGGVAVQSGLESEAACDGLVASVVKTAGRLDILVNNAAVFHKDTTASMTASKIGQEFWPNLFVPMLLTRAFAKRVKKGAIVNLVDRRITSLDAECVPYVLAKKSLAEFTKIAALDLAPRIRVNAVAPGAVLPPPGKGQKYLHDKAGPVPLKRQVKPVEVVEAVVFLAKAESMTGQILFVDGGQGLL
ncbi:MAG TPA: SDR family oxidoreductase [Kiritimatiellia bacterium]|nr:SDR family oxidoreductase [Kiritimatiellia bacterium]